MHTPACRLDSPEGNDSLDWWPQGAPVETDVSTLATTGITNPIRLPGPGDWLGIWGAFRGYRLATSPTRSFQVLPGTAVRYPIDRDGKGLDLYQLRDVGGTGQAQLARFLSREAALAWGGSNQGAGGPGGAAGLTYTRIQTFRSTFSGGNDTYTVQATTTQVLIRANVGNVGTSFIADTVARVGAATTRYELPAGASVIVPVVAAGVIGMRGTLNDTVDTIEYQP